MNKQIKILHLEDSTEDAELIRYELKKAKLNVDIKLVDSRHEFLKGIREFNPDVVISDHNLASFNSIEAFHLLKGISIDIPFIVVTGSLPQESGLNFIRDGANDYVLKSHVERLPCSIERAMLQREILLERKKAEILNMELMRANEEIEVKRNDILSGIHYASRILDAMLPGATKLQELVPSSFILNKPKEIIGGDFYFFTEVKDGFVFALADCTGHGVPGALISMIGYHILNDIVVNKKVTIPGDILNRLNLGIRMSLHQTNTDSMIRDGMDISVCFVNTTENTIEYAGANHSLYYLTCGRMFEIRGDKHSIGGHAMDLKCKFATHRISYAQGDRIYVSSDGYSDQFGGPFEKRIMKKQFSALLSGMKDIAINDQHAVLENHLNEWKGDLEQTDDVLVIGMEL
ncbi:MAG TPA: SpoIIE family protein phosphatase [Bacteroidia bacterium]|jgi:CheY-like chemotaxis protein|nr:SpoIIE family protein phosphatase [Bacteroidia bacterium]